MEPEKEGECDKKYNTRRPNASQNMNTCKCPYVPTGNAKTAIGKPLNNINEYSEEQEPERVDAVSDEDATGVSPSPPSTVHILHQS